MPITTSKAGATQSVRTIERQGTTHDVAQSRGLTAAAQQQCWASEEQNAKDGKKPRSSELYALDGRISALLEFSRSGSQSAKNEVLNRVIGVVIVLNAIMLALEIDYGPQDLEADLRDRVFWFITESMFIIIFSLEVCLRLYWERRQWAYLPWNWLDLIIVSITIVETWLLPLFVGKGSALQLFALLRVLRLVRLVRLVRGVRMFRALYVTVMAFKSALASIFYIGSLMVAGIFLSAIFTTSTIGRSESLRELVMGNYSGAERFGSIPRSMYSLFELMTLEGWEEVGRPLVMAEPLLSVFFFVYIMIFTFGLLNMIVAMVVEKTLIQARKVEELGENELKAQIAQDLENLRAIFLSSDHDNDHSITRQELEKSIKENPEVEKLFESMNIPTHDVAMLFDILDVDCSGEVSLQELLKGCGRIRRPSNIEWDMLGLQASMRKLTDSVERLRDELAEARGSPSAQLLDKLSRTRGLQNPTCIRVASKTSKTSSPEAEAVTIAEDPATAARR